MIPIGMIKPELPREAVTPADSSREPDDGATFDLALLLAISAQLPVEPTSPPPASFATGSAPAPEPPSEENAAAAQALGAEVAPDSKFVTVNATRAALDLSAKIAGAALEASRASAPPKRILGAPVLDPAARPQPASTPADATARAVDDLDPLVTYRRAVVSSPLANSAEAARNVATDAAPPEHDPQALSLKVSQLTVTGPSPTATAEPRDQATASAALPSSTAAPAREDGTPERRSGRRQAGDDAQVLASGIAAAEEARVSASEGSWPGAAAGVVLDRSEAGPVHPAATDALAADADAVIQSNAPRAADGTPNAHRVTLHFSGEDGLDGRLRLALRGDSVQATIVAADRATVERLEGDLRDLHRALAERGFRDARLAVHETPHTTAGDGAPRDGSKPFDERGERSAPRRDSPNDPNEQSRQKPSRQRGER